VTLTFDQCLGIAGLVAGIVGVAYGVKLDQKLKTAREAEKQIEKKFTQYMAADEFEELAMKTAAIMGHIIRLEWALVPGLAYDIGPSLGQVRGARNPLLQSLEKDRLDVAATDVQAFIDSLPRAGSEAERAGLVDGDRVLAIDGHEIQTDLDAGTVQAAIRAHGAGDAVRMRVLRDGSGPIELTLRRA